MGEQCEHKEKGWCWCWKYCKQVWTMWT